MFWVKPFWDTLWEVADGSISLIDTSQYYSLDWVDDFVISDAIDSGDLTASTHTVFSFWSRLSIDGVDTFSSQPIFVAPYIRIHYRRNDNQINARYDNAWAKIASHVIWILNRDRHHIVVAVYNDWVNWKLQLWVDKVLVSTNTNAAWPSTKYSDYVTIWTQYSVFHNGDVKDLRIWTFPWNVFDADDISLMYVWSDPVNTPSIAEYLWRATNEGAGVVAEDSTGNWRTWTLTGWVAHGDNSWAIFDRKYFTS